MGGICRVFLVLVVCKIGNFISDPRVSIFESIRFTICSSWSFLCDQFFCFRCLWCGFSYPQAKKSGDAASAKPRPKGQLGASPILLPPPPGGVKVSGPPRPSPVSQQQPSSVPASVAVNNMQSTVPINPAPAGGNVDLLVDLDASSSASRSALPHGTSVNINMLNLKH